MDDAVARPRVVVRSRVPGETGPSGGPALTDAVGFVEYADEHRIDVRRKDGTLDSIARADIVAMKPVPPARAAQRSEPGSALLTSPEHGH